MLGRKLSVLLLLKYYSRSMYVYTNMSPPDSSLKEFEALQYYWSTFYIPWELKKNILFFVVVYFLCQVNFWHWWNTTPCYDIKMCVYLLTFTWDKTYIYIRIGTFSKLLRKWNYLFTFNLKILLYTNQICMG